MLCLSILFDVITVHWFCVCYKISCLFFPILGSCKGNSLKVAGNSMIHQYVVISNALHSNIRRTLPWICEQYYHSSGGRLWECENCKVIIMFWRAQCTRKLWGSKYVVVWQWWCAAKMCVAMCGIVEHCVAIMVCKCIAVMVMLGVAEHL